ncbi:MAG: ABC transporter ATP-binding protein [Chitinispirillaceae bacterium]|nr:ABC transporter ATP-binding protein [Chitinispirillaceae bacterium]
MSNEITKENAVVFDRVCFSYSKGGIEVLHNISFSLPKNTFTGIVGPNGGGKTTLLRLIVGMEKPDKGSIYVLGKSPNESRKRVGYVMQYVHFDELFPVSALDVVLMGRCNKKILGLYSTDDKKKALDVIEIVGMREFIKYPFAKLSGGQRQRILIAQALVADPELLLLDEPTANVDPEGEESINKILRKLAKTLTIIMVSHNINTVLDCADNVICINRTATINSLSEMHPDLIEKVKGGGIAVLHHELNCRIFDKQAGGNCK